MNEDEYGLENFDDDIDSDHGHRYPPPRWFSITVAILVVAIIIGVVLLLIKLL